MAGRATVLEALQAGIAAQLAVLDDADITGTGQSSADVLGVPGSLVAERLAAHLVREIIRRGSGGGPLAPLANELHHDATHLQNQELKGMLTRLADVVRDALARAGGAPAVASQAVRLLPRPAFLAGREDLLADLDARLTGTGVDGPCVAVLCGLGGAGKTSVAVEYAYRQLAGLAAAQRFACSRGTGWIPQTGCDDLDASSRPAAASRAAGGRLAAPAGMLRARADPAAPAAKAAARAFWRAARGVESRGQQPELRDLFLCHAWDDRRGVATELNDLLEAEGLSVWFSEKDILLGQPFMREIDRGLAKSRTGLVLTTPALLERINNRGVSDKEPSELLARDR